MSTTTRPYLRAAEFLAAAQVPVEFASRALARIEGQHGDLGDSYLWTTSASLLRELREEADDLAAWSALIADRLQHDGADATPTGPRARALLTAITQRAAQTDALIVELARLLESGS